MRLTPDQAQKIRHAVDRVLVTPNRIWLFGSRVDDSLRGGDIDLLVETDTTLINRAEALCRLHAALTMALGDRKLDILLKDGRTREIPVFSIARRTGILL
ncbi:MAG: nucleotidyltransferase domain-containing protein [Pseudomonadota bacterium]